jgi:hypothetical protein
MDVVAYGSFPPAPLWSTLMHRGYAGLSIENPAAMTPGHSKSGVLRDCGS